MGGHRIERKLKPRVRGGDDIEAGVAVREASLYSIGRMTKGMCSISDMALWWKARCFLGTAAPNIVGPELWSPRWIIRICNTGFRRGFVQIVLKLWKRCSTVRK